MGEELFDRLPAGGDRTVGAVPADGLPCVIQVRVAECVRRQGRQGDLSWLRPSRRSH